MNIRKLSTISRTLFSAALLISTAGVWAQTPAAHRGPATLKSLPTEGLSRRMPGVSVLKAEPRQSTALERFAGRTFYGLLINSSDWANASITQVPYGVYSFTIGDGAIAPEARLTDMKYNLTASAYTGGQLFGIYTMDVMGALNGARYITLDTEAWREVSDVVHGTDEGGYSLLSSSMAYNYIDNTLYSLQYNDALSGLDWCRLNTQYQAMDKIAAFRGKYNVLAMATTPDGQMYFINAYGDLYKIDKKNGRPSIVAWTGITPRLYSQSMMYDNRTGLFLWAAQSEADGSCLYCVDPATAETEVVKKFSRQEQFTCLYTTEEGALDGAPAKPEDLRFVFDADGSLSGHIAFDVPDTTYDGQPLTTGATLAVWLDGESLLASEAKSGERVSVPVSLTEGNHYAAVTLRNAAGWSPVASVRQYAGYDTPLPVTDATFTHEDDGHNAVTWTAPAGGVNGGYVDASSLRYDVVRMPDSVTVASGLAETAFTEPTPKAMHNYSYRVTAVHNGHRSAYAETGKIACGDAFTTPYCQTFDSQQTVDDYITIVDNDSDNATWRYQEYGNIMRYDLYNESADDWLITPAVSLDGGKQYVCTLNLKTFSKGYPEYFEILLGTDLNDLSSFRSVSKADGIELYDTYSDYSVPFNTGAAGKYYLAVRYLGEKSKNSTMLLLKSISIDEIASTKAPAAPSGLTVTPGADDAMEATVAFTAPAADLSGETLDALTRISVYRSGESAAAHVFDSPAPGASLSWTDRKVPHVGMNAYSVRAENAYGEGAAAADSAFVGCYEAPYLESFNTRAAAERYTTLVQGVDSANAAWYRWKYDDSGQKMTIYAFNASADSVLSAWLITPPIRLDADAVYSLTYKKNYSVYTKTVEGSVFMGPAATPSALTALVGPMEPNASYGMEQGSNTVVTTAAGKYCFGFNIKGTAQYDNIMADMDDIALTYEKSALSPYAVTSLTVTPDATGADRATLSFKAPAVDYQGTRLTDNMTVSVYRGRGSLPVYTLDEVIPGQAVSWTDADAQHGSNTYTVIATNRHGKGEPATASAYVGLDRPTAVKELTVSGSADNMAAVVSWKAPAEGHHGGVVIPADLTYRVMSYDPADASLTTVAEGIRTLTYTVDRSGLKAQQADYYCVVAENAAGAGDSTVAYTTIGPLYSLPFKESFAGKELSTSPWIISSENTNVLSWGVADPTGSADSYNLATPQDGDGGCVYFYNGSYYETYAGAGFISPKMAIGGQKARLTYWVYNYPAKYAKLPYVLVYLRTDDGEFTEVDRQQVSTDDDTQGWRQYSVDLSSYASAHYAALGFYAFTAGYQECIYLDNIAVESVATGIDGTSVSGKTVNRINWYDLSGREVLVPGHGVYVRVTTYADGSRETVKMVR